MKNNQNNASNRRSPITWVPTAYFAMGLPFVVLNMVTVLMFKGLGVDDKLITFWTSLILLPWTLKPLWSPFLELFKTKKFFVVTTQLITGVTFGLVAFSLNLPHFFSISIALLAIIAFSGATHDIACDGVYMSELSSSEQAKYIGWQGAFYNIAKVIATGGLVYVAGIVIEHFSQGIQESAVVLAANQKAWMIIMAMLCGTMVLLGIYHIFMLPSTPQKKGENSRNARQVMRELIGVLTDFFRKSHIVYYLLFIILYRFAEGFVMKIVPLFLKADRAMGGLGLSEKEIGLYYGIYGAAAFVLGSLLAGYYISARGLKKTLFSLCCIFNLPFVVYALLATFQPESHALIAGGETPKTILGNTMRDAQILDLSGCNVEEVLYYVSCGSPVFAMTGSEEAVLLVGYDADNVIVYDSDSGTNQRLSLEEADEVFSGAGNVFLTYLK